MLFGMMAVPSLVQGAETDQRIVSISYVDGQMVSVDIDAQSGLTVMVASGEKIRTIRLSDADAWQIRPFTSEDGFFLRAVRPVPASSLAIETDLHRYQMTLSHNGGVGTPYLVRLNYSEASTPGVAPVAAEPVAKATYSISGNTFLRPRSLFDDGQKTFIVWDKAQPVPAVFGVDRLGREEMTDGYMRGGIYTIDHVYDRLVFRIDKSIVRAKRRPVRSNRN